MIRYILAFLVLVGTAFAATPTGPVQYSALVACADSGGNHLNYNATTGAISCGTSAPAPAVGSITGLGANVATALGVNVGSAGAVVTNNAVAQSFTGGLRPTAYSNGTGSGSATITVDCGNGPLQTITNGGAFTLVMAAYDGDCVVRVTNNASAGAVTFSGFTQGTNSGDTLDTTTGHIFDVALTRIGGNPHYLVSALQ
jgi:hypothetical protein